MNDYVACAAGRLRLYVCKHRQIHMLLSFIGAMFVVTYFLDLVQHLHLFHICRMRLAIDRSSVWKTIEKIDMLMGSSKKTKPFQTQVVLSSSKIRGIFTSYFRTTMSSNFKLSWLSIQRV
ncbi:unnamed protein product [Chrysodeixis includens]|uniref:Uncharacterized protein n=1 Tax=Chrysodeixis includens TaxID=689277 RepID=A0A9N8KTZ8_CHRIL|nr:unnamed protein product [Chrysodeixis includens]